ncbi:MAG: TIGR01777 family oxidoreductase [Gordonia sp. (in: high G+C Gram-positive bacteria)]
MRVAVAGSGGLIGSALVPALRAAGHQVIRLVRREASATDEFSWDPESFGVPADALAGVDAVVNLGGVGVADRRWTGRFRQELRDSRITPTEVLAEAVRQAGVATLLNASATGFYGDTGDHVATEASGAGTGFLAELVTDWEAAATGNAGPDTRVVLLRTAPVLAPQGRLISRLRPLYRLGLGGSVGDGRQGFSWISLVDEVRAIVFLLHSPIDGPVNLVAPQPVTAAAFSAAVARALHRPAVLRVPAVAARLVGGDMAAEMFLASSRVAPGVLTDNAFSFTHPHIDSALEYACGR